MKKSSGDTREDIDNVTAKIVRIAYRVRIKKKKTKTKTIAQLAMTLSELDIEVFCYSLKS